MRELLNYQILYGRISFRRLDTLQVYEQRMLSNENICERNVS